jgi:hypothetical protein
MSQSYCTIAEWMTVNPTELGKEEGLLKSCPVHHTMLAWGHMCSGGSPGWEQSILEAGHRTRGLNVKMAVAFVLECEVMVFEWIR